MRPTVDRPSDVRNAWFIWAGLTIVIVVHGIATGFSRNATTDHIEAATAWMHSEPLYPAELLGFVYPPSSAVIFIPFAALPFTASNVIWRILSIAGFAWGTFRLCRTAGRTRGIELFPLTTLVTIPIMLSAARNGQATLLMSAGMMLACAAVSERRWWTATAWLLFALALKPLAIVLVLLIAGLYPRAMLWRLAIGVVAVAAAPFLTQTPTYVIEQYVGVWNKYTLTYAPESTAYFYEHGHYADLFSMLHVFGIDAPHAFKTGSRVLAAGLTFGLGVIARRRLNASGAAVVIFTLAALYLMLFNPINENNTFALLAPALGLLVARALQIDRAVGVGIALIGAALLIAANFEITRHITPQSPTWLAPLVTIPIAVAVVWRICVSRSEGDATRRTAEGREGRDDGG